MQPSEDRHPPLDGQTGEHNTAAGSENPAVTLFRACDALLTTGLLDGDFRQRLARLRPFWPKHLLAEFDKLQSSSALPPRAPGEFVAWMPIAQALGEIGANYRFMLEAVTAAEAGMAQTSGAKMLLLNHREALWMCAKTEIEQAFSDWGRDR